MFDSHSLFGSLAEIVFPLEPWTPFGESFPIHPFGFLVGLGIVLGTILAGKRAKAFGLSERVIADVSLWAVIPGFIGAHLVHQLFYEPHEILENPLILFKIWDGISSFGGFLGGTIGVVYYFKVKRKLPFLPYADSLIYGFTFAWIFGRGGCTVAFDHPGLPTDFFLGMKYGGNAAIRDEAGNIIEHLHGKVIHNLGWYETLWAVGMFLVFWLVRNRTFFRGWYLSMFVICYMPIRFIMDFLRVGDETYLGLTPGQWISIGLMSLGVLLLAKARQHQPLLPPDGKVKLDLWPADEAEYYRKTEGLSQKG